MVMIILEIVRIFAVRRMGKIR